MTLTLRRDRFVASMTLRADDERPVAEVMAAWVEECHGLIRQAEFADAFSDPLPGDFAPLTPAMRLAALAADERERFTPEDREEWDRPALWGHLEAALASEG